MRSRPARPPIRAFRPLRRTRAAIFAAACAAGFATAFAVIFTAAYAAGFATAFALDVFASVCVWRKGVFLADGRQCGLYQNVCGGV
ncbi:MAG: hypothetical protein DBX55_05155 [Verrucomicrobia bacterium]|nr:MAG: hypothetical protein DBX55_05155 [Verrucomicrobiota bacterium]